MIASRETSRTMLTPSSRVSSMTAALDMRMRRAWAGGVEMLGWPRQSLCGILFCHVSLDSWVRFVRFRVKQAKARDLDSLWIISIKHGGSTLRDPKVVPKCHKGPRAMVLSMSKLHLQPVNLIDICSLVVVLSKPQNTVLELVPPVLLWSMDLRDTYFVDMVYDRSGPFWPALWQSHEFQASVINSRVSLQNLHRPFSTKIVLKKKNLY